jgi:hypothetical protein
VGRTIRFYTDEQVATAVVLALRKVGIDVLSAPEAGMLGAVDEAQLQLATSLGRVLFTEDRDFVDLHYSGVSHTGIAYAQRMSIGDIVFGLTLIWEVLEDYEMLGKLERL